MVSRFRVFASLAACDATNRKRNSASLGTNLIGQLCRGIIGADIKPRWGIAGWNVFLGMRRRKLEAAKVVI